MLLFAFYIVKVIICSGILFGYYWLLLRNKIFHQYNRFYLLASIVLSLLVPLVQINILHHAAASTTTIKLLQVVTGSNEYLDEIVITARRNNFTAEQVASLLYLLTSFVFLSLFIQVLLKIRTLLKQHRHTVVDNIHFVNTTAKGTPFSFLQYIFWNDHIDVSTTTGNQIFKHELAHVQQKHSYDKLFINAALIFFWCNPFFWLIRKELNMIHEFMADKIAVEDSDTEAFAAMILQATYPQHTFPFTNPFFYSPIKRRLLMLTKNKHPKASYIGRVLVLPLAVLLFAAFTLKTKTIKTKTFYTGKKITVVLDAGHGGKDFGAVSTDGNIAEKDLSLAIVKKIKSLNNNSNINIILTRENDEYQSPQEKAAFSKSQNPDLFVSIHIDGAIEEKPNSLTGMSIWIAKNNYANTNNSKVFASAIINEFTNNYKLPVLNLPQQRNLGIAVLQENSCPAVLIEAGYITNKKDVAYLQTDAAKETIAKNVLAAIEKYAVQKGSNTALSDPVINDTVPTTKAVGNEKANQLPKIPENILYVVNGKIIGIGKEGLKKMEKEIDSIHFTLHINLIKEKEAIKKYGDQGKNGAIEFSFDSNEVATVQNSVSNTTDETKSNTIINNFDNEKTNQLPANTLYVLDGKIQNSSFKLNSISPNDIESINVLKNKTAIDKYGNSAANGVIEINTKKNKIKTTGIYNTDDKIFTKVENEPKFPGGDTAWRHYLEKNLNAATPIDYGAPEGVYRVVVRFIVSKDGSISDVQAETNHGYGMDSAAVALIKNGPKWKPATQNGNIVTAYRKQPITFVVSNQ